MYKFFKVILMEMQILPNQNEGQRIDQSEIDAASPAKVHLDFPKVVKPAKIAFDPNWSKFKSR